MSCISFYRSILNHVVLNSHFEDVFLKAAETKRLEDHGEAKATHFPAPNTRSMVHEKYVYRMNSDGLSWTYLKTVNVCDKDTYRMKNILFEGHQPWKKTDTCSKGPKKEPCQQTYQVTPTVPQQTKKPS